MGLAEDIQQSKFRSNHQRALINIIYTNNWLLDATREFLAPVDLTPQQYNVLRILRGSAPNPLSTLQIRERMLDKMSDTSRIVDRLITKDLVSKNTCKTDKRLVDIFITEKGLELLSQLDKSENNMDKLLSKLSDEEAGHLSDLLDKIRVSG